MARTHRTRDLVVVAAVLASGCGGLPPDSPPARPAPPDPGALLVHDWRITGHVLGPRALISDDDATGFHDRTVAVTATGYSSPWSGRCDDAHRKQQPRTLAEIAAQHVTHRRAASLGLTEPIVEYQLLCTTNRNPPLTLYVAGSHAVTCWSGVCYLLAR